MSYNLLDINLELISAISNSNLNKVREIINYVDLSSLEEWENGFALLRYSIQFGHNEVAKLLLELGIRVTSERSGPRNTALYWAIRSGNAEIVEMLLSKGVNVNEIDAQGMTPLHISVENGNLYCVRILLSHKADVDAKTKKGETPLLMAVKKEHSLIVKELLRCGPNIMDKANRESLLIAIVESGEEYKKIADDLLKYGFTVNINDTDLIFKLVKIGNYEIIKNLLYLGANVNSIREDGSTLLHCAIENEEEKIAQLLLSYKCDVNAKNEDEQTPIYYAVQKLNLCITKMLLVNKANVKCRDKVGASPLHYVSFDTTGKWCDVNHILIRKFYRKDIDVKQLEVIAKLLLNEGVEVDAKTYDRITALHIASINGSEGLVKLLLDHKADIDSNEFIYKTPLYFAIKNDEEGTARLLLERNANVNARTQTGETALWVAIERGNKSIVELLLNNNADVNAKNNSGYMPLFSAAFYGKEEIARMLLNKGAEVNAKCMRGLGVLHRVIWGCTQVDKKMLKLFIEYNADVNARCNEGQTPLHFAVDGNNENAVEILLEFGADFNITNINGNTPLDEALYCPETKIMNILKEHKVKLEVAGLYISKKNLQSVESDFNSQYRNIYEKETQDMKNKVIRNTIVSFHSILTKNKNELANYFKNENVLQALESEGYKTEFPSYAINVTLQFKKGMERKNFLDKVHQFFNSFPNNLIYLPHICTDKIFCYLNNEDLSILSFQV